jgi:hypothetical protein
MMAFFQWLCLAAIFFSPLWASRPRRWFYTGLVAAMMVVYLPGRFGHMYNYQVLAGMMLLAVFAQYSLPAIMRPLSLTRARIVLGNLLLSTLPFLAVTYVPAAGLIFLASLRKDTWKAATTWALIGVAANVAFLAATGSIQGYLAYHFYLNLKVLPLFGGGGGLWGFLQAIQRSLLDQPKLSWIVLFSLLAVMRREGFRRPWRSLLLAAALMSLLIRGNEFHGLAYFYSCFALPVALAAGDWKWPWQGTPVALYVALAALAEVSLLLPGTFENMHQRQLPETTEFAQFVRAWTEPEDRILAYSFQNYEYLAADRLPASGHFFYLPWQAKYNEKPVLNMKIDPCEDILKYRPKVILLKKEIIGEQFAWDSYAGCVQTVVDENYDPIPGKPFYVRKDLPGARQ